MQRMIKAGVAGAGVFGGYHAQKYAAGGGATLAGVYDPDPQRAAALAGRFGAAAFTGWEAFLDAVEVVSLTAPAAVHATLGLGALQAGRALYIEKPLAADLAGAEALCRTAEQAGLVLASGHQERETLRALGLLGPEAPRPQQLEAVREGPWSGRGGDVSVFLDLMIHDGDFALALFGEPPVGLEARGQSHHAGAADEGEAHVRFAGGGQARLRASRVAGERRRTLSLGYGAGWVEIDFLSGAITDGAGLGLPRQLPQGDPLGAAIARFLSVVRGDGPALTATGRDGLEALRLALAMEAAAGVDLRTTPSRA